MNPRVEISVDCANVVDFDADVLVLKYAAGLYSADLAVADALHRANLKLAFPLPREWRIFESPGSARNASRFA